MKALNKKSAAFFFCTFAFLIIFFMQLHWKDTDYAAPMNISSSVKATDPSNFYPPLEIMKMGTSVVDSGISKNNSQDLNNPLLTEEERYKWESWRREHGYFNESDLDEYRTYDIVALRKLALDGDQKALELVARHRMAHGEEAHIDFYYAALHGSTHALVAMSYLIENKFMEELSDDEKVKYSVTALAYLSVAGKRGDEYAAIENAESFKARMKFNPTPEQQILIDKEAAEIYKLLASQRMEMGLPDFNNTSSPEMHKVLVMTKK